MNEPVTYTLDLKQSQAAMEALFYHRLVKGKWPVFLLSFLLGLLLVYLRLHPLIYLAGLVLLSLSVLVALALLKNRSMFRTIATAQYNLHDEYTVRVTLTDKTFIYERAGSRLEVAWSKMTHLIDDKNHLILLSNVLIVAALPKAPFSPEQIEIIRGKAGQG